MTPPAAATRPPLRVKVCGVTREVDARAAVAAGADYLGLVLAPGPRHVALADARRLAGQVEGADWVGVFASSGTRAILETAAAVPLRVVQLHGPADVERVGTLRAAGLEVWVVVGVDEPPAWGGVAARVARLLAAGDAVLLDRRAGGRTGGAGAPFDWRGMPPPLRRCLALTRFGVAGGLGPDNVAAAVDRLDPDFVDASGGLESSPGRKDAGRVRGFVLAARSASAARRAAGEAA